MNYRKITLSNERFSDLYGCVCPLLETSLSQEGSVIEKFCVHKRSYINLPNFGFNKYLRKVVCVLAIIFI